MDDLFEFFLVTVTKQPLHGLCSLWLTVIDNQVSTQRAARNCSAKQAPRPSVSRRMLTDKDTIKKGLIY